MKISIIGGGNMGGAIARGLSTGSYIPPQNITVIGRREKTITELKQYNPKLNVVINDYSSLNDADITIIALKPWLIEEFMIKYRNVLSDTGKLFVSVAGRITLDQLENWTVEHKPVFRIVPNTAIAQKQSMTFVSSKNTSPVQNKIVEDLFMELGRVEFIEEKLISAATSLTSCGIAYAFRYIRAAVEGGVEMGFYPQQAKQSVLQTLRGAIELLEANNSHPEEEIDKVTTPGGMTIKGLNEMEHAGFTSAVIKGLKASNVK